MALNVCNGCTTKFAVGLKRCPHCASKDFQEEGPVAKITALGGASDATLPEPELHESPGTDEPAQAVEGDELTGDGSDEALPSVPEESYGPDAVALEEAEQSSPDSDSPEPEATPEPAYEDWTVEQLKEELAERNLPKSGKRDDLVQRLRDADAEVQDAE